MWLDSDKDYQDARHIYNVLKAHMGAHRLREFITELRVKEEVANNLIGEFDETK